MSTTNLKPCRTNNTSDTYKFITVLFKEIFTNLSRCQTIYFIMILLSIYRDVPKVFGH